jgi:hypothetical protein
MNPSNPVGTDEADAAQVKTTEDGEDTLHAVFCLSATGYLTEFTKKMKEDSGIEPEMYHMEDIAEQIIKAQKKLKIRYASIGFERGANGTIHFQVYFQLESKCKFSTFNNRFKKLGIKVHFHLEESRGSAAQNIAYTQKPTGTWEYASGVKKFSTQLREPLIIGQNKLVAKKGVRTDLKAVTTDALAGEFSATQMAQTHPTTFLKYSSGIMKMKHIGDLQKAKESVTEVTSYLLWSKKEGTGKTTDAESRRFPAMFNYSKDDVFIVNPVKGRPLWFDGYDDEKVLIIDDLAPNILDRNHLLKLLQPQNRTVEIKGASVVIKAEYVFVTSNYSPMDLFRRDETFTEINEHGDKYTWTEKVTDTALISRFNGIINYDEEPNYRKDLKQQKVCKTDEFFADSTGGDKSGVGHYYPTTLELAQFGELSGVQSGGVGGAAPHQGTDSENDSTLAQNDSNLGTIQEGEPSE